MLPDHSLRPLIREAVVVVRDARTRAHEHVADARRHLGVHADAEQPRSDRLVAAHHPGAVAFGIPPSLEHRFGRAGCRIELKEPRLPRDELDVGEERVPLREEDVTVGGNVDHSVIGGDDGADAARQRPVEVRDGSVDALEPVSPAVALPAVRVPDRVEFGRVDVHERAVSCRGDVGGAGEALLEALGCHELRTALGGAGEARVRIHGLGDDDARATGARLGLEKGRRALPDERIESVGLPALELIRGVEGARHSRAVADDAVLSRVAAGEKTRDGGRRRRGECRAERVALGHLRNQETRMS